ncbi:ABC-2 type transport system ATP-binding protein [Paenibacillus rhizosphaerae]|uniref:ABC-2 type transport system ATP-binding protein n=1 Tax=Paenibacillus rhizosphaerae TaxID=297318 RepID=A0A839TPI2_9BACL|nr:ATP-binding cassette domain-containing protein [Paenibacillus rhizosphaerae]MBB3128675.1 ABC-2 type transport system ATP-binding protein [Paenibacillus rhizosphaerae]
MNSNLLLQTRNLTKSFGDRKIINRLNLHVMKGDIYGFLGRNGQGKTTAIRLVTGLIFPDSGDVIIDGHHLRNDFKNTISNVGAIVESPSFYGYLSGYDNLKLMANLIPGIKKDRIDEVLDMVRLNHRAKDKVKTYSLGMKQRLGIANALLSSPKLIILDEPTNGLDPQGMKEIKEMIVQLAAERNITFFISSHLLHEVEQICNRVGIIHSGTLLCEAEVEELTQKSKGKSLEDIYFDITGEGGDLA